MGELFFLLGLGVLALLYLYLRFRIQKWKVEALKDYAPLLQPILEEKEKAFQERLRQVEEGWRLQVEALREEYEKRLHQAHARHQEDIEKYQEEMQRLNEHVTRSKAVIRGKIVEALAPILPNFPLQDPQGLVFIGGGGFPCDFLALDGDRVVFIEVKAGKNGKASLSPRERAFRDAILSKRVEYQIYLLPHGGPDA